MTDKRITTDINAVIRDRNQGGQLAPAENAPAQRARRGMARTPQSSGGSGGSGGGEVVGPLVEASAATREYWPDGFTSSDGLFVLPAIKKLTMTDAGGQTVLFEYANPHADNNEEP